MIINFPFFVCPACGHDYGHATTPIPEWRFGTCPLCHEKTVVTEPKNYGLTPELLHEILEPKRNDE